LSIIAFYLKVNLFFDDMINCIISFLFKIAECYYLYTLYGFDSGITKQRVKNNKRRFLNISSSVQKQKSSYQ